MGDSLVRQQLMLNAVVNTIFGLQNPAYRLIIAFRRSL